MKSLIFLPALAIVALSSCGGESADADAPVVTAASVAAPDTAAALDTVAAPAPTATEPTVDVPDTAEIGAAAASSAEGDVAPLRTLAFEAMVSGGISEDDANCIADALDFDDVRTLQQDPEVIGPVFESCGLPAPDLD